MLFKSIFIASLIICLLAMVGVFVVAQQTDNPPDKKFAVGVIADSDNELELRAASYIKRELRSLGDVEVVDYGEWILHLMGSETENVGGRKIGIILGVIITRNTAQAVIKKLFSRENPMDDMGTDGNAVFVEIMFHDSYQGALLYLDGNDNLRRVCEKAVTDFDVRYLEPERKK